MPHPNEPSLDELYKLRVELYVAPSTNENLKKVRAIEAQIKRREEEDDVHGETDRGQVQAD